MSGRLTFGMIKPNVVEKNQVGEVLKMVEEAGFLIRGMRMKRLSRVEAEYFYAEHKGKDFFEDAIRFVMEAPVVALVLEKDNAVAEWRKLIGNTDYKKAEEGTIRKIFAESLTRNAVHGADSDESFANEAYFFFSKSEIYNY